MSDAVDVTFLRGHSLIVVDNESEENMFSEIKKSGRILTDKSGYSYNGFRYNGSYAVMQIMDNPWNEKYHILYINTNDSKMFAKNIFTRRMVFPAYVNGMHKYLNKNILIFDENGYKTE